MLASTQHRSKPCPHYCNRLQFLLLPLFLALAGCTEFSADKLSGNEVRITKQEYGGAWPFTVDEGVLACKGSGGLGAVVFTVNGRTYGVNGIARGGKRYEDIDQIWANHPSNPGAKKNMSPITERGLKLCQ